MTTNMNGVGYAKTVMERATKRKKSQKKAQKKTKMPVCPPPKDMYDEEYEKPEDD